MNRSAWRRACVSEHTCVEVSDRGALVAVRDSVQPTVALTFAAGDWRSFVAAVKDGTIDAHRSLGATGSGVSGIGS
ncbi:DUF397 domain-containing protein [Dactylosporangium darangshiense]|uniref:DUF397 domain-containing protein n=1 Tax=Dactylosporangium darangshiense TaxID=579108 RepID=UPI0031EC6A44